MVSLFRWQKDCYVNWSQTSYRNQYRTQLDQKISQVVWSSCRYSSPTGLSARGLGGCPWCIILITLMYGCSWRTLQAYSCLSPLCWTCNHRNYKSKSISSVATLSTVLVEPTYLQKISNSTSANAVMKIFVKLAQSLSPEFWIVYRGGVPLVVWCHNSGEQIVFPSFGGF